MKSIITGLLLGLLFLPASHAQTEDHSVARQWNEVLLEGIRGDRARPVVHARNLYHISAAMYDTWAAITGRGDFVFLGRTFGSYEFTFDESAMGDYGDEAAALDEAISYVAYRIIRQRFFGGAGQAAAGELMVELGYDTTIVSPNYTSDVPAHLGNYIAEMVLAYGLIDGSNEVDDFANQVYEPSNIPLEVEEFGTSGLLNPDGWQPLAFDDFFIDQSGNPQGEVPPFLGAEWGQVIPFALGSEDLDIRTRPGDDTNYPWFVYHDPGPPPYFDIDNPDGLPDEYRWGFELVVKWSSQLDPADTTMWDISPGSIGNFDPENYPTNFEDYRSFYEEEGGDISTGHDLNPVTGEPYEPNLVKRADYARVLAEFWADGPDSETPPGHWFTILNGVMDHPLFERKFKGEGEELSPLEYDVKAYLTLGGTMHDAAIATWSVKGWYDYVRPISAIRFLAALGQRTDPSAPNYNESGITLDSGYIENFFHPDSVDDGRINGFIRFKSWLGHRYIDSADIDVAGVDWINAQWWVPYQRPSFVTPNFAGYVSGHSTFSSAAAEVMTLMTGSPFFPGGVGEFEAPANEFLVFEDGPSEDIILQWATYRDASDQTSLSRIWGGIHPPADDIPGRIMGIDIGQDAFALAEELFDTVNSTTSVPTSAGPVLYPNPISPGQTLRLDAEGRSFGPVDLEIFDALGRKVSQQRIFAQSNMSLSTDNLEPGIYF
ncbi:MAG: T9SS type A sorting domain-containing protein, partial [Bacteroidota bacterium]